MRIAVPAVESGGKLYVSPHFGRALYFAVYDVGEEGFKLVAVERNPAAAIEERGARGRIVVDLLMRFGVQAVIAYEVGPGAFYRLAERGVKVFLVERVMPVEEALKLFAEGKLREVNQPVERD